MKEIKSIFALVFLLITIAATIIAQAYSENIDHLLHINQGWTLSDSIRAWTQYEGSQIMPAKWFEALESFDSSKKFKNNLEKFGFIPVNPLELPIGLTVYEDRETSHLYGESKWVGVNCTACHTGMIEVNGRAILLEGGSALFNIQSFENSLVQSVSQTLKDPDKFHRFMQEVSPEGDETSLKANLNLFLNEFRGWMDRNHRFIDKKGQEVLGGPGRVDGLGGATNDLICRMTDRMGDEKLKAQVTDARNCRTSHPPTSLPHLWGMTQEQFVQWNGAVHSSLGRNYGQATATYGKNWVEKDEKGQLRFRSTANVDGLYELERLYDKLRSPRWKDLVDLGIVNPVNDQMAQRGRAHFVRNCAGCHSIEPAWTFPNYFGNSYWQVAVIPASIVGTESAYLDANTDRWAILPKPLAERYKKSVGENSILTDQRVSSTEYRAFVIGSMIKDEFELRNTSLPRKAQVTNCRDNSKKQPVVGFKARSLEGVIFTAPYLHNGSVPTLVDLLKPAVERPKEFYLGCRQYDVEKMGYDCKDGQGPQSFLFRVSQYGNSNKGHEYGTKLSELEKQELIEFMKGLEQPRRPIPKNLLCN